MAQRQSTYLTDSTLAMVRPGDSVSGRINGIFDRYAEMLKRDTRETLKRFSKKEQQAILIACTSQNMDQAASIFGSLAVEVGDSTPEEIGLTGAEQEALIDRLGLLTAGQQLCLAEWIEGERTKDAATTEA